MDHLYAVEIIPTDYETPYALTVVSVPQGTPEPCAWLLDWAKKTYGAGATLGVLLRSKHSVRKQI